MTDRVWVAIEAAVRTGLDDKAALEAPPTSDEDVMWLNWKRFPDRLSQTLLYGCWPPRYGRPFRWYSRLTGTEAATGSAAESEAVPAARPGGCTRRVRSRGWRPVRGW
jgi:hypothetical protein